MSEVRTYRPFQERFLDGYNRSQLKRDLENVRPLPFSSLPKKCATLALGVSLALAGIAVSVNRPHPPSTARIRPLPGLATDLQTEEIAADIKVRVERGGAAVFDEIKADFFRKHVPFGSMIYNASKKNNVSPELVAAVARAESAFHSASRPPRPTRRSSLPSSV